MVVTLRRRTGGLIAAAVVALGLAACGANGEGAPGSAGCPVGSAASSCSSSSTSSSTNSQGGGACNSTPQSGSDAFNEQVTIGTTTADGLKYGDIAVGCGAAVKAGDTVYVQYTGWLESNGTQFDSSRQSGRSAFSLTLGQGQVIKGWEEGIPGMHIGGKRRLIIPPSLGYGANGSPPTIPPNSTLVFDVELVQH